jgi:hypothetical protein
MKKKKTKQSSRVNDGPGAVAQAFNTSYSEGRDQ